jgi:hypothetical protein
MTAVDQEGPAKLLAAISAKLGLMVELGNSQAIQSKRANDLKRAELAMQPTWFRAQGTCVVDSGGFGIISFSPNGPDQGHVWEILNAVIGGVTFKTTATGTGELYISGMDLRMLGDASPPITDLADQASSLPLPSGYSKGQIVCQGQENPYVRIVGGASAQTYAAVIRGLDYQEAAFKQVQNL